MNLARPVSSLPEWVRSNVSPVYRRVLFASAWGDTSGQVASTPSSRPFNGIQVSSFHFGRNSLIVKNRGWIGIDAGLSSGEARRFMSKPALGRGLASLLGRPGQIPERDASGDDGGVQLLLRGTDGTELLPPPIPVERRDEERALLPRWALGGMLVLDAGLIGLAGWVALGPGYVERLIIAGLMVCMGGLLLAMAVYLRGQSAVAELNSLNPIAEEKPRIRVQFLDESSGRRPGKE